MGERAAPTNPFLGLSLVDAVGTGAFASAMVVIFSRLLGLTSPVIAVVVAASALVAALVVLPSAAALELVHARRAIVALNLACCSFTLVIPLLPNAAVLAVVLAALNLAQRLLSAARGAALAAFTDDPVRFRAQNRVALNLGLALGSGLAAIAIAVGSREALITLIMVDGASFLACALLALRLPRLAAIRRPRPSVVVLGNHRFLATAGVNAAASFHNSVLVVGVPLWILSYRPSLSAVIPLVLLGNTVLVVMLQQRATRGLDTLDRALKSQVFAGGLVAGACGILGATLMLPSDMAVLAALAVVTALSTLAEIRQAAGGWELSYMLAEEDRMTQYQAAWGLSASVEEFAGPLLISAAVVLGSAWWAGLGVLPLLVAVGLVALLRRGEAGSRSAGAKA